MMPHITGRQQTMVPVLMTPRDDDPLVVDGLRRPPHTTSHRTPEALGWDPKLNQTVTCSSFRMLLASTRCLLLAYRGLKNRWTITPELQTTSW